MQLEIHYRDMESSDGIRTHIEQKAEKLKRFTQDDEVVRVVVGLEGPRYYAEIFWHGKKTHGKDFFAKEEGENLYAQIDRAFEVITQQIAKEHDKDVSRHHKKEALKKTIRS